MKNALIVAGVVGSAWWISWAATLARRRWREHCGNLEIDLAARGERVPARVAEELERRGPPPSVWAWALVDAAEMVATVAVLPALAAWGAVVAVRVGTARAIVAALLLAGFALGNLCTALRRARRNQRAAAEAARQVFGGAYDAADWRARDRMEQIALRALHGVGQDGLRRD